jgi:hypothetical protein
VSSLAADFLLFAWLGVSIFLPGIAICHRWTRLRGLEAIGYGAAAGVTLQAVFGLLLVFTRAARVPVIILSGIATLGALVYLWRSGGLRACLANISRSARVALGIWILFVAACIALTHLEVTLPAKLPDGFYIFKDHTVNVKMQYLVSLPADNYLPYIVSEFFLRRISFRRERPILPRNEVSSRTILMSLVALPYRAALAMPPRAKKPLETFSYAGRRWPDVSKLYREDYGRQMLVIGIFLNSLLLLGLITIFSGANRDHLLPLAAILYFTNPYLLSQTVFIWPKALAGFFLLLAWHAVRRGYHPAIVAGCAGLAYHSHPLALPFAAGLGLFYALEVWGGRCETRSLLSFAFTFLLVIVPWIAWTKLYLQIPSGIVWENVAGAGTDAALASPLNFVWVRLRNLTATFTPGMFFVYPFDAGRVVEWARDCLPGAVGIFLIVPAFMEAVKISQRSALGWCAIALPLFAITALFSLPAIPLLHGYQSVVGALIFLGVIRLARNFSPAAFWSILILQLAANITLLEMRAYLTGLHLP